MPTVTADDGFTLRYAVDRSGSESIVFLADACLGPWQWGWQVPSFGSLYQTITIASRGTNGSEGGRAVSVDRLCADIEVILADANVRTAHFVGAGLGGCIALEYQQQFNRAKSVIVFGTPRRGCDVNQTTMETFAPRRLNEETLKKSHELAFSLPFLTQVDVTDLTAWRMQEDATEQSRQAHLEAFYSFDPGAVYELTLPTLVFHGVDDPVVPFESGESLSTSLPRGTFVPVEGKRLSFIEHSQAVNDRIFEFFETC